MAEAKSAQQQFEEWMASQSGYIGKEKKAGWWDSYNQGQTNQKTMNNIFSSEPTQMSVGGSAAEQTGRLEGLQRAKMLTGQNSAEIGKDYQEAYGNIKKRTQLADTGSELIRNSKAGAVADARNQLQQQGVKGGAALGAVSAIERSKSYDVNNQLVENQRKAEMDYLNATKANANFTNANEMNFGAMGAGKDFQAPGVNSSGFGTVICTELYKQGFYTLDIYTADQLYGVKMMNERPYIYWGYRLWADSVVRGMQKSKLFTKLVAFFAVPWARNMAGDKNLFGKAIAVVGEFVCGLIGKIYCGGFHANQKA